MASSIDASGPEIPEMGLDQKSIAQIVAQMDGTKLGVTGTDDPKFKQLSIFQKLAVEKAYQPANSLKSTTVYDAIGKQLSMPITNVHQIAGYPVDAAYCDRGQTDLAVDVMVCEFRDDASAIKSRAFLLKSKHEENRDITALKGSWVSVTVFGKNADAFAQQKKIVELVKNL